jgi:nucleotide-binding universal stress UspA family protein
VTLVVSAMERGSGMQRMLVGVDGSAAAHNALVWSADVAHRGRFDLVVARVFEPTQAELSPGIDTKLHAEQRAELEGWCENVDAGGSVTPLLLDGGPPEALLAAAVEGDADLIVVGGGAVKLGHLDASSVSDQLVHTSTLPLAVVPTTGAAPPGNIVLAVDGSPESLAAADFVVDLAARLAVGVTAVFAFEPFVELVPETDPTSWRHEAERGVRRWVAPIEQAGVAVDLDIERDVHPVAAIRRTLDAHPDSVACLGARRLSDVTGLRLGRIPLHLLDRKTEVVILVPRQVEE